MSHPIGINLGSNCSVAKYVSKPLFTGSELYHIPSENAYTMTTDVFFDFDSEKGEIDTFFGRIALSKGISNPNQYVKNFLKKINNDNFMYEINGKQLSTTDISSIILRHLLHIAEGVEGPGTFIPKGLVLSVPYYLKNQHQIFKLAALKTIRELYKSRSPKDSLDNIFLDIIYYPISVSIYYAYNNDFIKPKEIILIFHLGSSKLELSIVSISKNKNFIDIEIILVDDNDQIGGSFFDESFLLWLCIKENIDLSTFDNKLKRRFLKVIKPEIIEAKHTLSTLKKTDIIVPNAIKNKHIEIDSVERSDFEKCITGIAGNKINYIDMITKNIDFALQRLNMYPSDIESIICLGGSSQIPIIQKLISNKFSKAKIVDTSNSQPGTEGAAIYAAYLHSKLSNKKNVWNKWDKIDIAINKMSPYTIGIDLSSSYCSASIYNGGITKNFRIDDDYVLPPVVQFRNKNKDNVFVGKTASRQSLIYPSEVFTFNTQFLQDESWKNDEEVIRKYLLQNSDGIDIVIKPSDIGTEVLKYLMSKIKKQKEIDLLGNVQKAVFCVPTNPTEKYRENINKIATRVGFKEIILLEKPVSAAIEYAFKKKLLMSEKSFIILFFNIEMKFFEVNILKGNFSNFFNKTPGHKIITNKFMNIGSNYAEKILMDFCVDEFSRYSGIDIYDLKSDQKATSPKSLKHSQQKLKSEIENVIISFIFGAKKESVCIPDFLKDGDGNKYDFELDILKKNLEFRIKPILELMKDNLIDSLKEAKLEINNIDIFIINGKSIYSDWIIKSINSLLKDTAKNKFYIPEPPDLVYSKGAAIFGAFTNQVTKKCIQENSELINDNNKYKENKNSNGNQFPNKNYKPIKSQEAVQGTYSKSVQNSKESVFICYSSEDKDFVFKIATSLKKRGIPIWLDQINILPGADWDMCIDDALYECTKFLIFLSPSAYKSKEVRAELQTAFDENKEIIPIILKECKIPRRLKLLQHVNILNKSLKIESIVDIISDAIG